MENKKIGIITEEERRAALQCLRTAVHCGASAARVSLSKSVMDSISMLNGKVDKVTHCADRSIFMYIWADGRYGTFSTNSFDRAELEDFIVKAVDTVRMLAPDSFRSLPNKERCAKDALTGNELGLVDLAYAGLEAEDRLSAAKRASLMASGKGGFEGVSDKGAAYKIISEECEYSDGIDDSITADSQGFEGRHIETSYSVCTEMTIADAEGNRYSGYYWTASPESGKLEIEECSSEALRKAVMQIGPKPSRSGQRKMIVDRTVASRLVAPILNALDSNSIQQKNSFLADMLGKQVFSPELTIMDSARTPGMTGSRLYDAEGVATVERPIVKDGVVMLNWTTTYMANKMGIEPTCDGPSRPVVCSLKTTEKDVSLENIMAQCRNGVYVTGFNGGNCNPVTGDFSYGIEGFTIKDGHIGHPVKEMLITGNMIDLWKNLIAAGTDARSCAKWSIPTLAFDSVNFSA